MVEQKKSSQMICLTSNITCKNNEIRCVQTNFGLNLSLTAAKSLNHMEKAVCLVSR